jgi:hypothetical protein
MPIAHCRTLRMCRTCGSGVAGGRNESESVETRAGRQRGRSCPSLRKVHLNIIDVRSKRTRLQKPRGGGGFGDDAPWALGGTCSVCSMNARQPARILAPPHVLKALAVPPSVSCSRLSSPPAPYLRSLIPRHPTLVRHETLHPPRSGLCPRLGHGAECDDPEPAGAGTHRPEPHPARHRRH